MMLFWLFVVLACLMGTLQVFVRRRIRYNATHFVRGCESGSPLTPLQRWTLAAIARYLMPLELSVDCFRPPEFRRVPTLTSMLTKDWNIKDRSNLLRVIEHLQQKGHRAHCAAVTGRPASDFLAWDLLRVVLLAWAGVNLEWLSHAEFATIIAASGSELQATYADWEQAAASYEAGLLIWTSDGKIRKVAARAHLTLEALLHDPDSPWKSTSWQTPLAATIAE